MFSASGFRDGLGQRDLQFDRETGEIRERLFLRPELAAYESALRRRIGRLASLADPRLVQIQGLEHDRASGHVAVVSRHVSGMRLTETLRAAREREVIPDLTISLFLAAEILTAAHTFHALSGLPHGLLATDRVVITADADVVLADYAYAEVIEATHFTPRRLWDEFDVAPGIGHPFSFAADVRQGAVIAIALMLGRPLEHVDLPGGLEALLSEVEEAAMIRGGRLFAEPVINWLTRAIGAGTPGGFNRAAEAVDACLALLTDRERAFARTGFVQFLTELEPVEAPPPEPVEEDRPFDRDESKILPFVPHSRVDPGQPSETEEFPEPAADVEPAAYVPSYEGPGSTEPEEVPATFSHDTREPGAYEAAESVAYDTPESIAYETPAPISYEPIADETTEPVPYETPEPIEPATPQPDPVSSWEPEPVSYPELGPLATPDRFAEPEPESPPVVLYQPPPIEEPTAYVAATDSEPLPELRPEPAAIAEPEPFAVPEPEAVTVMMSEASARAGTDEGGPRVVSPSPFALLGKPRVTPPPAPARHEVVIPPLPRVPSHYQPTPPPVALQPHTPLSLSAASAPIGEDERQAEPAAFSGGIRLKDKPPPKKATVAVPRVDLSERQVAIFEHPEEEPRAGLRVPWKFGAAAAIVLVAGLAVTNMKWPGSSKAAAVAPGTLVVETTPPGSEVFIDGVRQGVTPTILQVAPGRHEMKLTRKGAEHAWAVDVASGARRVERLDWTALRQTGGIEVVSNAPGSKVLIDGKLRGETPLVLGDLTPGRHLVVVQGPNGNVRRRVTVVAGETTKVDLAIYSGWVIVSAPIELQILENGNQIGTAGEGPVVLSAGPHTIELVNSVLAYRSSHTVEIGPGEEERLNITPKGRINVNAIPWAEVFIDGERIGETPLANVSVTLGARELLFKHPEHGERRMPITVTGGEPAQISVDLTRPPSP